MTNDETEHIPTDEGHGLFGRLEEAAIRAEFETGEREPTNEEAKHHVP